MDDPSDSIFTTPSMGAVFAPGAHVAQILAFEAALARAQARAGVIPTEAADAIAACCRVERFDVAAIYQEAARAGTVAIPLVRMLTAQVPEGARGYVHWGATSQDAIDTALMLQMRAGLGLLEGDLLGVCASCATLADEHRGTLMAGRTLLQHAVPITFGLKAARWLALATRQVVALRGCHSHLALQCGGAAGTLAALGGAGLAVADELAAELKLPLAELPWHTERDRVAAIACALGVVAGAMAKIAGDIALLAQSEVGEVAEGAAPGKGGSSAMPQKRNPVDATLALACARLAVGGVPVVLGAMAQEHERAVGGWQAEWHTLPALFRHSAGAIAHLRNAVTDLEIDAGQMQANLDGAGGLLMAEALTMALAPQLGRPAAQQLVGALASSAQSSGTTLREATLADQRINALLPPPALEQTLDPTNYLGSTDTFIDRALAGYRAIERHG